MDKKLRIVLASGSFDPLHIGHLEYLKAAKKLGDILVVAIKGNERLKKKKKRHFMTEDERKNIMEALKYVDKVIVVDSDTEEAAFPIRAMQFLKPNIYASGEVERNLGLDLYGKANGIKIRYGVGGKRIRSSSELLKAYYNTPWEK